MTPWFASIAGASIIASGCYSIPNFHNLFNNGHSMILVDEFCLMMSAIGAFEILNGIWPLHYPVADGIGLVVLAVTVRCIYRIRTAH